MTHIARVTSPNEVEPEVLAGRRAWNKSQELLKGAATSQVPRFVQTDWYGTDISEERGAFCLVQSDSELVSLVGDILRVRFGENEAFVYCLGSSADLERELSLSRRAFSHLALLSTEFIYTIVEVTG